ncbi:MAG: hypothetical protein Q9219_001226 [cf. Caloplaca sp. 3 TL-2023]
MPLNYSAAHSSRITKRTLKPPRLKRSASSSSSPFTTFPQRKPIQRSKSKPEPITTAQTDEDFLGEKLDDRGLVTTLATDLSLRDVPQIIQYANAHMFDPLPERGGGFNSTKIAEILNIRSSLPATVTVAHVHAMSTSPTATERETAELMKAGVLKKIVVPGRGTGGSSVGEGLVLLRDLEAMLERWDIIDDGVKESFLSHLRTHPTASAIPITAFSPAHLSALKRAGFLISSTIHSSFSSSALDPHSTPSSATSSSSPTSLATISRAASGSLAAIGGSGAVVEAGGTMTSTLRRTSTADSTTTSTNLQLSLPNMGPYLRLLTSARTHFLSLLRKSGGPFRELPLSLLRERWDGGSIADRENAARKARGEFAGIVPARTRKWKMFWGLRFEWVLAECVGAGMVEVFETGSVGKGVRAIG